MRLIDSDEFEDALENTEYDISPAYEPDGYSHRLICKVLEETPTVDAVPVVRCRECKYAERYARIDGTTGYYCGHPQNTFVFGDRWDRVFKPVKKPDDFCSHGHAHTNSTKKRG